MIKQLNFYNIKTNSPEFFQGYFFFVLSKITYLLIIDIQKLATKNQVQYFHIESTQYPNHHEKTLLIYSLHRAIKTPCPTVYTH